MLHDWRADRPIRSPEHFEELWECSWYPNACSKRVSIAYKTLIAAQQGNRDLYLRERLKLQKLRWQTIEQANRDRHLSNAGFIRAHEKAIAKEEVPAFWRIDSNNLYDWYELLGSYLLPKALALAYEVEESAWKVIAPGSCGTERIERTMKHWQMEIEAKQSFGDRGNPSVFMRMMDYRIRKSLTTGTRKHLLINELIDSDPYVKVAYEKYYATSERRVISRAIGQSLPTMVEACSPRAALRL